MLESTKLTPPQDINFVVFVEKRGKKIFLAVRPTNEDSLNGHASNTPPRESRIVNQQFLTSRGQSSFPLRKAFPFSRQRLLLYTRLTNCLREDYRERRRRITFSIFLSFLFFYRERVSKSSMFSTNPRMANASGGCRVCMTHRGR